MSRYRFFYILVFKYKHTAASRNVEGIKWWIFWQAYIFCGFHGFEATGQKVLYKYVNTSLSFDCLDQSNETIVVQ